MILQVNMRWKALAEVYKMHPFAPFSWDPSIFCLKIAEDIVNFRFAKFVTNYLKIQFIDVRADLYRNFTKSCRINKNYQIFVENC